MENKDATGYQLKFIEYKPAAEAIMGREFKDRECIISADSNAAQHLYNAKVLEMWFKPLYFDLVTKANESVLEKGLFVEPETWYIRKDQKETIMYHDQNGKAWGLHNGKWLIYESYGPFYTKGIFIEASREEVTTMYMTMAKRMGYDKGRYIIYNKRPHKILAMRPAASGGIKLRIFKPNRTVVSVNPLNEGYWLPLSDIKDKTWYTHKEYREVLLFHKSNNSGYGIMKNGEWLSTEMVALGRIKFPVLGFEYDNFIEVPDKEVVAGLLNYAITNNIIDPLKDTLTDKELDQLEFSYSLEHEVFKMMMSYGVFDHQKDYVVIMEKGVWEKPQIELPLIMGYKGEYNEVTREVVYNKCAALSIDWFSPSKNRTIQSMVLSSGVVIHKKEMEQIRQYLIVHNLIEK